MPTQKTIRTYNSVDNLPDEVPTDRLEEFRIRIGRGQNDYVEVSDDANFELQSFADETDVIWERSTDRFTVSLLAHTCHWLHLDWLYTKARIDRGGHGEDVMLLIEDSARYGDDILDEYSDRQVIQWINEDRRELGRIMEAYCYYRSDTEIFDAEAVVKHHKIGRIGNGTISECIYDSYEDFYRNSGYAQDIIREAISEARDTIHDIRKDLCRP